MVTHSHKKLSQNNLQINKSPSVPQPTASTSFSSTTNHTKSSQSSSHSSKAADTSSSRLITKHIKIKYPSNHKFQSKQPISKKNYKLSEIIEEICQHETQLLNEKEEELTQEYKNHTDIHQSMVQLLASLPNILRDEYQINEQLFEPEISKSLRQEIQLKTQQLRHLTQYSQQLSKYQEDMHAFGDAYDLWLGHIPKDQNEVIETSEHVSKTSRQYKNIMNSIDNSCDEILSVAQHCDDEIQSLQALKNKLYDEFNLLRTSDGKVPTDPKPVIRDLVKFL